MQQTAINLLKKSWAPSGSWNFYTSYIVALYLFCCHCRRRSYLSSIIATVPNHSEEKIRQTVVGVYCNGWEKIKLEKESISEILIADTRLRIKKMFSDSRVAITNTSQRNHPPKCPVICVLLVARERAQCINAPDVMWACAWCLV